MNMQNKAKKLIEMIQTASVEWKPLGEVFDLKNGYTPSKSIKEYWENGSIPWFRMEDIRENGRILDSALQQISESAIKGGKLFPANSIIMATSATIGEHALITVPFLANQRFTNLSLKPEFTDKFDIYFLYYYCFNLSDWCKKNTTTSSFASVDMNGFKRFPIPIPPLETQQKIVKILDKFTELEATLEAELQLRKQQYNYYRDFLLNFAGREDVLFKKLSEVTNFQNGKGHEKDISESGKFIVVNSKFISTNGQVLKYSDKQLVPLFEDDILIVMSDLPNGKVLSKTYLVKQNNKFTLNQRIGRITVKNKSELLPKFVSYFLDRTRQLTKYDNKVDQTNLRKEQILEVFIPIPPLSEQARIVAILDKFDTLTTSLSDGLPREIALRRKQYEYYREQLLAFPKAA